MACLTEPSHNLSLCCQEVLDIHSSAVPAPLQLTSKNRYEYLSSMPLRGRWVNVPTDMPYVYVCICQSSCISCLDMVVHFPLLEVFWICDICNDQSLNNACISSNAISPHLIFKRNAKFMWIQLKSYWGGGTHSTKVTIYAPPFRPPFFRSLENL